MKKILPYAVAGLAGYFIGFYEMKYKVVKAIAQGCLAKPNNSHKEEES